MAVQREAQRGILASPTGTRRTDWLGDSLLSGFIATFAMSVVIAAAFGFARLVGDQHGSLVARWFWALSHNPVIRTTADWVAVAIALNLLMGLVWAIVYGFDAEPRLVGSGWRKGMIFALGPWLLSVIAFLPIMGGGFLGRDIDAGPLPVLGNLILHLVYGGILGSVYAIDLDAWLDGSETDHVHNEAAQRGAAIGLIAGLVVGLVAGWFVGPAFEDAGSRGLITLAGAFTGGALGLIAGSMAAIDRGSTARREARSDTR